MILDTLICLFPYVLLQRYITHTPGAISLDHHETLIADLANNQNLFKMQQLPEQQCIASWIFSRNFCEPSLQNETMKV